jgi:hypothetical protein
MNIDSSLELKYVYLLSTSLIGFKETGKNVFNCRCPFCGDSKRKKSKKRGYIYEKKGKFVFYCHNCTTSKPFRYFLKDMNEDLYSEFLRESLSGTSTFVKKEEEPVIIRTDVLARMRKVSQLPVDHFCKKYVVSRQIPTTFHHRLYFTPRFRSFVNSLIPGKFADTGTDEPRLIIPIYRSGKLVGFQGRSLLPSEVKYITIVLDETAKPMMFGYDDVDFNKKFFIFEGPIDSMFIPNSMAICGSSLVKAAELLKKPKTNMILVFDNEPRNKEIVESMKRALDLGFRICVFPSTVRQKDINEMILKLVVTRDFVDTEKVKTIGLKLKRLIEENVYFGLAGELKLSEWSKV